MFSCQYPDFFKKSGVFYAPKMAQKFIFPESGLKKFFHASKMCAIDSPTRKTLVGSKISSKIDFYNLISTFENLSATLKNTNCLKVCILTRKHDLFSKRPIGSYSACTLTHYLKKISSKTSEKCLFSIYFS